MKMSILWIAVIAICLCHKTSSELPPNIQKCHAADGQCIIKAINDILRSYPNGYEGLGLVNLEPVHLDEVVVARTAGSRPLNLDMKFVDLDIYGLSKLVVNRVEGFEKDPLKSKFEMYLTMPELILRGKYETNGRILLLPIAGKGKAEVRLKNLKSGIKAKLDMKGKLLSIKQLKVQNKPEKMTTKLENLFNGNKDLGDELNRVLNNSWEDVWEEMQDGINDAYSQIVRKLMDNVFKTIHYDDFYLTE